ncbi:hypothetical protein FRC0077_02265 [Corynebacterium diphtheriae]|nr:hypothetical protein FRC0076_02255 [Corynebacterium diphtheriae]CAB0716105.1 hypothetical protein FRC0077_02265 [Corynebacterium diphtheriae]
MVLEGAVDVGDYHDFLVYELVEAEVDELAAESRALCAAEWDVGFHTGGLVDVHHAGIEATRDVFGFGLVLAEYGAAESEWGGVGDFYGVVDVAGAVNLGDGAEKFGVCGVGVEWDVGEDGGLVEGAVFGEVDAHFGDGGAFGTGFVDEFAEVIGCGLGG